MRNAVRPDDWIISASESQTARNAAQSYIRRGWKPIPVGYRSKRPTQWRWQHRGTTAAMLDINFPEGKPLNVGVILGGASGGLTDVDLDCSEAIALAKITLPHTEAVFGRVSKPERHFLYYTSLATTYGKATLKFTDPITGQALLEVRIGGNAGCDTGAQTIFPGSVHASGEDIEWSKDGDPAHAEDLELLHRSHLLASLCLMARYWPSKGGRHDAASIVGGFLSRYDHAPSDIKRFVDCVAKIAGCRDCEDRSTDAEDAANAHLQGTMVRLFGKVVADQIAEWQDPDRGGLRVRYAPEGAL
jgi:hypothetical protein